MCTVAFIPKRNGGYLLGHNRDESRRRKEGQPPQETRRDGRLFVSPRDPDGGGTWIGVNESGLTLCLLNAPQADGVPRPRHPKSRGMVAWDLLHLPSAARVKEHLNHFIDLLGSVRAFHLVAAERGRKGSHAAVHRFRWDGAELDQDLTPGPALFVSSGYDQAGAERNRFGLWSSLLEADPVPEETALSTFLSSHHPEPSELSVCMHRQRAYSVSRTLVRADTRTARLTYHAGRPCDMSAATHTVSLPLSPATAREGECS